MAAVAVEAQFKYSYEYEGKTISFKKGERFSLIKKVNGDWWQVKRKYDDGKFENIYVPANYMKEVEDKEIHSHTYQNMSDLQAEYLKAKEGIKKPPNPSQEAPTGTSSNTMSVGPPPTLPKARVSPKVARTKSNSMDRTSDGQNLNGSVVVTKSTFSSQSSEPEYAVPHSPVMKKNKPQETVPPSGPIIKEWQKGYSLPHNLKGRSVTMAEGEVSSLDTGMRNSVAGSQDQTQKQQFQTRLNMQLGGGWAPGVPPQGSQPPVTSSQLKAVPVPKPKPKPLLTPNPLPPQRPKSFCVDDEIPSEPSTFTGGRTVQSPPVIDGRRSFKKPVRLIN